MPGRTRGAVVRIPLAPPQSSISPVPSVAAGDERPRGRSAPGCQSTALPRSTTHPDVCAPTISGRGARYSFRLVRVFFKGGSACHRWAGTTWR